MEAGITLVFTPDRNKKKKDFTGAFRPESTVFARTHNVPSENIVRVDISKRRPQMRKLVLDAISETAAREGGLNTVAFFCHGTARGIQLGFQIDQVNLLAKTIAEAAGHDFPFVILYACSAANSRQRSSIGGDGGFCDELRDALCRHGAKFVRVVGHKTVGHTTKNPFVRFFEGAGLPSGGTGGFWVVRPQGPLWNKWVASLRQNDFRFKFPFMELDEIRASLS